MLIYDSALIIQVLTSISAEFYSPEEVALALAAA